ncbi:hypothetical protein [Nitrospira moscoviensis]|uniref:Uncharacterized protein n=1 Tax=Nitrospira moscoviensis TaxID=42253 RepID=A0A0K2GBX4_NITMO|nr:hypothetical protein [Nitrospira moscoviensis]ALA58445.1 hypothetical protein NITMOv2_2028 [Nitrospira moscoviensis]
MAKAKPEALELIKKLPDDVSTGAIMEELEDRIDLADARAALAETKKKGAKSLDAILKDLGL